ncbi:MAG TPA: hypothetical protein PKY87_01295 [Terricaulis sp.]|nr:hypothetical protein [Terricaulis sp.]
MGQDQTKIAFEAGGGAPVAEGDIFVIGNDTIQPADMRAGLRGHGRVLHCDADLKVKGALRTTEFGLLIGLAISPEGQLFVSCPQTSSLGAFTVAGAPVDAKLPPRRRYGNVGFDKTGRALVGVHSAHGEQFAPDGNGDGKLVRFDPKSGAFEFFDVEIDGGRGGKHFVSNFALAPDGETVFYVSEAGRRVLRYHMGERRQLPDFLFIPEEEGGTYGLDVAADGRVIMAKGIGAAIYSPEGKLIRTYEVSSDKGWTRTQLRRDESQFFISNFLDGVIEVRDVETGALINRLDIGLKGALTSVAEYPLGLA